MSHLTALWPLHRAIVAAWAADAAVVAAMGAEPAIYSGAVPAGVTRMPRVVLGYTASTSLDTFGEAGGTPAIDAHAWTAGAGHDRILPLCAALCDALSDAKLAALTALPGGGGWRGLNLATEIIGAYIEPDNVTMHGVIRLTCILMPT
jgi:hypothetical protein